MAQLTFLLRNFFTHRDFLPQNTVLPGMLFTPLHFVYEAVLLAVIIVLAIHVSKNKHLIKPVFTGLLGILVILEICIDVWETMAGYNHTADLSVILPLYPCSIFMYVLPMIIWGKGIWKQMGCGYVCTLGFVGAAINFIYPSARLLDYSCISFPGFHTFFYHGSMLFAALVLILSGTHSMYRIKHWWSPFLASVPGLTLSIPANILNYSQIHSDYMYFTGKHFMAKAVFGSASSITVTVAMYAVYLLGPMLFYWVPVCVHCLFKRILPAFIQRIKQAV